MDGDALAALLDATDCSPSTAAGSSDDDRGMAPLCVRIHRLRPAQAERIASWAASVGRVDVLADVTVEAGRRAVVLLRDALQKNTPGRLENNSGRRNVRIVEFDSAAMERAYPALNHNSLLAYRREHLWMLPRLHAWAFTAAIVVCGLHRGLEDESGGRRHCWVFEHTATGRSARQPSLAVARLGGLRAAVAALGCCGFRLGCCGFLADAGFWLIGCCGLGCCASWLLWPLGGRWLIGWLLGLAAVALGCSCLAAVASWPSCCGAAATWLLRAVAALRDIASCSHLTRTTSPT